VFADYGYQIRQDVQRYSSMPNQARPELWDVEHRVQMTTEPGAMITVNQQGEPRIRGKNFHARSATGSR